MRDDDEILGPIRENPHIRETLEEYAAREVDNDVAVPFARVLLALADDEVPEEDDFLAWLQLARYNDRRSLWEVFDMSP